MVWLGLESWSTTFEVFWERCKNNLGTVTRILEIQKDKLVRIENPGRSHVGHGTNLVHVQHGTNLVPSLTWDLVPS